MKFLELLERFFPTRSDSRNQVKERLRFVLAHDRSTLPPEVLAAMRQEILAVVSKYVEIEQEAVEINLEMDQRTTTLIANLPIVKVKPFVAIPPIESFVLDLN